jgi:hypothetical protein
LTSTSTIIHNNSRSCSRARSWSRFALPSVSFALFSCPFLQLSLLLSRGITAHTYPASSCPSILSRAAGTLDLPLLCFALSPSCLPVLSCSFAVSYHARVSAANTLRLVESQLSCFVLLGVVWFGLGPGFGLGFRAGFSFLPLLSVPLPFPIHVRAIRLQRTDIISLGFASVLGSVLVCFAFWSGALCWC